MSRVAALSTSPPIPPSGIARARRQYYGLTPIDARSALFIIGSDVLGPMGRELIPLADAADAAEFVKDHGGTTLPFDGVTAERVKGLD